MTMTRAKSSFALRGSLVTGTTVATDTTNPGSMTVTGIATEDVIVYAESRIIYGATIDDVTDVTSTMTITAANTVTSTSNTSTKGAGGVQVTGQGKVFFLWADASL